MNIPGKLVVRAYAPGRRWTVVLSTLLIGALALYGMFELGRYKAGYDAMLAAGQRNSLQQQIDELLRTQHELQVQLAAADEARVAEVRERADVARTIGELQAEVERQQKDVEFYRGIVAQPGQGVAAAVRVEQFHIATLPRGAALCVAIQPDTAAASRRGDQRHARRSRWTARARARR